MTRFLTPLLAGLLLGGCKQDEGERCQINRDCAGSLVCCVAGDGGLLEGICRAACSAGGEGEAEAEGEEVSLDGAADVGADLPPDVGADVGADLPPDVGADVPPDTVPDMPQE